MKYYILENNYIIEETNTYEEAKDTIDWYKKQNKDFEYKILIEEDD